MKDYTVFLCAGPEPVLRPGGLPGRLLQGEIQAGPGPDGPQKAMLQMAVSAVYLYVLYREGT